MVKKLILFLIFIMPLFGNDDLKKKIYKAGEPYDLSLTLLAIAKVESNFGKVKINLNDPSCGLMQIHVDYFLLRYGLKLSNYRKNLACQELINNDDLSISEAISILLYWKKRLCSKWGCTKQEIMYVWGAYNAGNNYKGKRGQEYAKKILKEVEFYKKNKIRY